jgi:rSAM/selenodomain-associated transferase 1
MASKPVAVAVLAKAPIPGFAKTRLIPTLGAEGAAALASRLIDHAVATACEAGVGPVTLWAAPDETHEAFQSVRAHFGIALARQPDGDLGARMLAALAAVNGPALVIGTDCPALTADHLRAAAEALRGGSDVVVCPAEDGGYVLIGARKAEPALFSAMPWSTAEVMNETRRRLKALGLTWQEPVTLWDVDAPADLARMRESGMGKLIPEK